MTKRWPKEGLPIDEAIEELAKRRPKLAKVWRQYKNAWAAAEQQRDDLTDEEVDELWRNRSANKKPPAG